LKASGAEPPAAAACTGLSGLEEELARLP